MIDRIRVWRTGTYSFLECTCVAEVDKRRAATHLVRSNGGEIRTYRPVLSINIVSTEYEGRMKKFLE